MSSKWVAVAAICCIGGAAQAGDPVDIPGSSWDTEGAIKTKAEGEKQVTDVDVTLEFGPGDGLESDEFRMTVDDGEFPVVLEGTYDESKPGKPSLEALDDDILDALELDLEEEGIEIDLKGKIKAKASMKDGEDVMKLKFKMKAKVSVEVDGKKESAKASFDYKGDGGRTPELIQ